MSVTLSTFPSFNTFTSRSWTLIAIVLLHMGFFWAFSSGLAVRIFNPAPPVSDYVEIKRTEPQRQKLPEPVVDGVKPLHSHVPVPMPPTKLNWEPERDSIRTQPFVDTPPATVVAPAEPVVVDPSVDPRYGLSEPTYPSQEIRLRHTGTVMLLVEVLPNGRVGTVSIETSSGYQRLDDAATREARNWRFKPGTSDGVPTTMWKRIPITFQLN